jgi:hypothetical protein
MLLAFLYQWYASSLSHGGWGLIFGGVLVDALTQPAASIVGDENVGRIALFFADPVDGPSMNQNAEMKARILVGTAMGFVLACALVVRRTAKVSRGAARE